MFISESKNPVSFPQQAFDVSDKEKNIEKEAAAIDFDKMLVESNSIKQSEFEKEKNAVVGGEYRIGETKNDKEFREQLEKITGKKQEKSKNKLDQNDYLTLLVTQLKYQDPSKPMEHYEMASQMAQFNTVEQLVGVNKSLTNMGKAQTEAKSDKLSQYLDKYIEVQGNNLKLNPNNTTSIARFTLPSQSSGVSVEIKDFQGKVIRSIALGEMQSGSHEVHWDGKTAQNEKAAAGDYSFSIIASTDDGKPVTAKTSYLAKVNGVTDISGGGKLDTTAGIIEPEKIISIRNYEPSTPPLSNVNITNEKDKLKTQKVVQDKGEIHGIN
ncbi:MAG: flagellar hook capping FlgD N-terminal domain-containing protein [Bdellovibrionota bacterium]